MMKSDLKLIPYAPVRPSVKLATRTQHGAFRLRYAAAVVMAFVFSGLAPAVLMALIWRETSLSPWCLHSHLLSRSLTRLG
jgi:hypothetical protein